MKVHLHYLLDGRWNHLEDTSLGIFVRIFPEGFDYGGKIQPDCRQHISKDLGSRVNRMEKTS